MRSAIAALAAASATIAACPSAEAPRSLMLLQNDRIVAHENASEHGCRVPPTGAGVIFSF